MTPEHPMTPREELEVKVTALLMGELSGEEASALTEKIAADPELKRLHDRLQNAIGLLREATAIPELPVPPLPARLSSERREKLLAHFKTVTPPQFVAKPRRHWIPIVPLSLAAVLTALLGGVVLISSSSFLTETYFESPNFGGARLAKSAPDTDFPEPSTLSGIVTRDESRNWSESIFHPAPELPPSTSSAAPAEPSPERYASSQPPASAPTVGAIVNSTTTPTPYSIAQVPAKPRAIAPSTPPPMRTPNAATETDFFASVDKRSDSSQPNGAVDFSAPHNLYFRSQPGAVRGLAAASPESTAEQLANPAESAVGQGIRDRSGAVRSKEHPSDTAHEFNLQPGARPTSDDSLSAQSLGAIVPAPTGSSTVAREFLEKANASPAVAAGRQSGAFAPTGRLNLDAIALEPELTEAPVGGMAAASKRAESAAAVPSAAPMLPQLEELSASVADLKAVPSDESRWAKADGDKGVYSMKSDAPRSAEKNLTEADVLSDGSNVPEQVRRFSNTLSNSAAPVAGEKAAATEMTKLERPAVESKVKLQDEEAAVSRKPAPPADEPQPEIATSANAFSTFSLNVSDVAFKLAARESGAGQDAGAGDGAQRGVHQRLRLPRSGTRRRVLPLAFATERARYPFAQNRDLLRFSVKTAAAGRQPGRALNLVLLLDNSGSMERADRVRILREALRVLAAQLQPQDKLSVVTFARTPRLWVDGVAGDKAGEAIATRRRDHAAGRHESRRRARPRLRDGAPALPGRQHQPRRPAHRRRGESRRREPGRAQAKGRGASQAGRRARLLRHRLGRLRRRRCSKRSRAMATVATASSIRPRKPRRNSPGNSPARCAWRRRM